MQRVVDKPSPPREHSDSVSAEWNAVILRCLARDPAERPASAGAVAAALQGQPLPSRGVVRQPWLLAGGILLALIALLLAGMRWITWSSGQAVEQQVALLPLSVAGEQPELRVFALGLMETVTSRLSQFEDGARPLLVVPASEVRSQQAKTARDARRLFQASVAVEGSLQGEGDRVRLVLMVIDTARLRQVETITLDDTRANALRLQDAAVTRLANALDVRLQGKYAREQQELMPVTPGAYEFYLQARGYLQRPDQAPSLASADTLLQRVLALDPKFALAHSALGAVYAGQFQLTREPKLMDQALQSAGRGLALNPNVAETHISMGRIHLAIGRFDEARQDFERAIAMDGRNNAAYQGLAEAYFQLKDYGKAEATYRKAISLRPGDWSGYHAVALFYFGRKEFDKAIEACQRVVELSPDNARGYMNMGAAYGRKGDWANLRKVTEKALALDPTRVGALSNLGKAYYELGQYAKAVEMYQRTIKAGSRSYRAWGQIGAAYRKLGQSAKAQEGFAKAAEILEAEILVNPQSATTYSSLAFYRALLKRRDFVDPLRRSQHLAPGDVDVLTQNAESYAIMGDRTRALELVRQALALGEPADTMRGSEHLRDLVPGALATR